MRIDRLKKTLAHFRTVPAKFVELVCWRCGTLGCVFGHACDVPEFAVDGLRFNHNGRVEFGDLAGIAAAMKFYGLTYGQADFLFCGWSCLVSYGEIAKDATIARLEKFIAKHEPKPPVAERIGDRLGEFAHDLECGLPIEGKYRITRVRKEADGAFVHEEVGK
jgi:hypothetical protein